MQAASGSSAMRSVQRPSASSSPRCAPGPVAIGTAARRVPRCIATSAPAAVHPEESSSSNQQPNLLQTLRQYAGNAMKNVSQVASPFLSSVVVVTSGGNGELYGALSKAMEIYLVLLTVRVLMSWFRNLNWNREPFNMLRQFTDPYLNLFRGIIPPLGGMDLSPMLGFFLLSWAARQLKRMSFGL